MKQESDSSTSQVEKLEQLSSRKDGELWKLWKELFPHKYAEAWNRGEAMAGWLQDMLNEREEEGEELKTEPENLKPYEKDAGEFIIDGLTEEEYRSWVKAGVPFYRREIGGVMQDVFNPAEAVKAQEEYCEENNAPFFAPNQHNRYQCYSCGRNIYVVNGRTPGYSVEYCRSHLITGCPFCQASYVD